MSHADNDNAALRSENARLLRANALLRADLHHVTARLAIVSERRWSRDPAEMAVRAADVARDRTGPVMAGSVVRRVYVAGPMAGVPDHNFPAFRAEASRLRAAGYEVLSPAEGVPDADVGEATESGLAWRETQAYKDYLKRDLRMVLNCDAVSLLPGWENSRGAQLEVHVARAVGIQIWEPNTSAEHELSPLSEATEGDVGRQSEHGLPIPSSSPRNSTGGVVAPRCVTRTPGGPK